MLKYGIWDLPDLEYFSSKNIFSGSSGCFRFRIEPDGENLAVWYWYGDVCFEKRGQDYCQSFPAVEKSLYDINVFLSEKCASGKECQ